MPIIGMLRLGLRSCEKDCHRGPGPWKEHRTLKYLNQINLVLMLVGCVIVIYAFSVTFWQPTGSGLTSLPMPEVGREATGTAGVGAVLRRSTTTAVSAVDRPVTRRTQRSVTAGRQNPFAAGSAGGMANDQPERRTANEQPGTQTETRVEKVGTAPDAVTSNTSEPDPVSSRPGVQEGVQRNGRGARTPAFPPAPSAEAEKRTQSRSPTPPPTRSSAVGRPQ